MLAFQIFLSLVPVQRQFDATSSIYRSPLMPFLLLNQANKPDNGAVPVNADVMRRAMRHLSAHFKLNPSQFAAVM
jgi:hypothetical protein